MLALVGSLLDEPRPVKTRDNLTWYFRLFATPGKGIPVKNLTRNPVFIGLTGGGILNVDANALFDRDENGWVDETEFVYGMAILRLLFHVKDNDVHRRDLARLMFLLLDADDDGTVTFQELRDWLRTMIPLGVVPKPLAAAATSCPAGTSLAEWLAPLVLERYGKRGTKDGSLTMTFEEFEVLHRDLDMGDFFEETGADKEEPHMHGR